MKNNHYVYKITNIITHEFYIGVRSCYCNIDEDSYMGSSSIWTKLYIKEHKDDLVKEILEVYSSRKLANDGEVFYLKKYQDNSLCINKYFDYTSDMTGVKQSPEWIEKRKRFGEANGMFGKHHNEETKQKMRDKLKGRKLSEATKEKIKQANLGKTIREDTKQKMSKKKQKIRHIENVKTGESWDMSITEFSKKFPELNINVSSMRKAANEGYNYKKTFKITEIAAIDSNINRKLSENGENPEVDNPVGSAGSE